MADAVAFLLLWALGWWLLWRVPTPGAASGPRPPVTVVVPARDEEANVGPLLGSLGLGPDDEVLVVDDHSTDATAAVAGAAGATVVAAPPLPDGWAGKPWACHTGAAAARHDRLVFLDADTRLAPGGLDRVVADAAREPGLYSVQPFHEVPTAVEQGAAFFNVVGLMGSRGGRVAFGPCLSTTVDDYRTVGGHQAVRAAVVEDAALAAAYRRAGLPVRVRGGRGTITFRMYPRGLGQLVEGFTKNMAAGAGAIGVVPALLVAGWLAACAAPSVLAWPWAAAAYALVAAQLHLHLRRLGSFHPLTAALYPLPLALFLVVFLRSALLRVLRRPVSWKGRRLPPA